MEVNKKQLADIFGASIRTIQNWQEQGMPVLRGGGKGNEVLYDSAAVIRWYAERDAEIENENPNARIIVNRGDLPVIKLGIRMLGRRPNSILKAGQHRYQRAFIQRLNNGRWHVMQRLPQARYEEGNDDKGRKKRNRLPIQVVKIPMAAPLKQAFDENVDRIRRERLPKELAYALKQQLRIAIKR
ncbi:terminase small subunit [Escherichia coli]